jgi:P4 family phage/plasmid primase-like protien
MQNVLNKFRISKNSNNISNLLLMPYRDETKSIRKYGGSYYIPNSDLDNFYLQYSKTVLRDLKKVPEKRVCFYVEKKANKTFGPLNIDLDFRWNQTYSDRLDILTIDFIKNIANIIKNVLIDSVIPISNSDELFKFYILMRDNGYNSNSMWKDGAHIQFPHLVMSYTDQIQIRNIIIHNNDFVEQINKLETITSIKEIYDESIARGSTGWMLFGSTKPQCEHYNIVWPKISIMNENILDLIKLFSILNKHELTATLKQDIINNLSIKSNSRDNKSIISVNSNLINEEINEEINEKENKCNEIIEINTDDNNIDINDIIHLVNLLSRERAENYTTWIKVGLCLHNLNFPKNELLDIFKDFSKQISNKYNEEEVIKIWNNLKNKEKDGLSIGSLRYWAKMDHKGGYDIWLKYYDLRLKNKEYSFYNVNKDTQNNIIEYLADNSNPLISYLPIDNFDTNNIKDMSFINGNVKIILNQCVVTKQYNNRPHINIDNMGISYRYRDENNFFIDIPDIPCALPENIKSICLVVQNMNIINEQKNYYGTKKEKNNDVIDNFSKNSNSIIMYNDEIRNKLFFNCFVSTQSEAEIGKYIYYLFKDIYRTNKSIDGNWYYFNNHKWNEIDYPKDLDSYIDNNFITEIRDLISIKELDNDNNIVEHLRKIIQNCGKELMKINIIKKCKKLFQENNFSDKLDQNNHLLAFNNGIYDLDKDEFRDGKPEDFISMSTNYDYDPIQNLNYYNEIKNFMNSILDEQEVNYLQKFCGYFLTGNNTEGLFHIFSGIGSNGKSILCRLIYSTLGDYCGITKSTFMTGKRNGSQSHDSDLIALTKKRVVISQEPQNDESINSSFVKTLSGTDMASGRKAHSPDEIIFEPKFKLILCCNKMPKLDNIDGGTQRRFRCIEFPYKFVENPINQYEKLKDTTIIEKINFWKNDIMLYFLDGYRKFKIEGLKITTKINNFTSKYNEDNRENDSVYAFMKDMVEEATEKDVIFTSTLLLKYLIWNNNKNPDNLNILRLGKRLNNLNYITKTITKDGKNGKGIRGYKFVD